MAFVPRVHNREAPVASRPINWRSQRTALLKHAAALQQVQPRIDNKWGGVWNGVKETKRPTYPHVSSNLKRAQLQDERFQAIEQENYLLLGKLSKILERPHNPTHRTREWGGGVRLTSNQVPVIDHCVPHHTTEFGAAVEPTSLNYELRQRKQDEIAAENRRLVARIQMSRPTYERSAQLRDFRERERWLLNKRHANRPLSVEECEGAMRLRPASAAASVARRPASAASSAFGGAPVRRDRPRTALPKHPSKPPPPIDESVVTVLELLASQMQDADSLARVREKREVLMDAYKAPADVELSTLTTAGVRIEVTRPSQSDGDKVLVLVHGGMFMSGSGRAVRHLAAKLAVELRVAVACPSLRLAPEHPHPAALDDLCAAYDFLATRGVSDATPPSSLSLFAESSGGALALSLLLRRNAAHESLPAAVVMSSPWLDLTCSGGSFKINEDYDLVLQTERMLGIAKTYVGDADAADPEVSPLLCTPRSLFGGLPPMLVHVGEREVLLDDARSLAEYARLEGSQVILKEWPSVVHAWHTFFPIMPQAAAALQECIDFLRPFVEADDAASQRSDEIDGPSPNYRTPADDEAVEAAIEAALAGT